MFWLKRRYLCTGWRKGMYSCTYVVLVEEKVHLYSFCTGTGWREGMYSCTIVVPTGWREGTGIVLQL